MIDDSQRPRRGRRRTVDPSRCQTVALDVVATLLGLSTPDLAQRSVSPLAERARSIGVHAQYTLVQNVNVEATAASPRIRIDLATPASLDDDIVLPSGNQLLLLDRGAHARRVARQLKRAIHEADVSAAATERDPEERRIRLVELRLVARRRDEAMQPPYLLMSDGVVGDSPSTLRMTTWDDFVASVAKP